MNIMEFLKERDGQELGGEGSSGGGSGSGGELDQGSFVRIMKVIII